MKFETGQTSGPRTTCHVSTHTCEQEIKMASEMENVTESFVFSSKDPTCCDLLRAFAHIG